MNSNKLRYLVCYGTKLDTLDVSSCPKLFDTYMQGEFSQTSSYDRYYWKDGSTIKRFPPVAKPEDMEADIQAMLK